MTKKNSCGSKIPPPPLITFLMVRPLHLEGLGAQNLVYDTQSSETPGPSVESPHKRSDDSFQTRTEER